MDEHKIAIVTGASSGIGAAVVKKLSSKKFIVIMLARNLDRMEVVAKECNKHLRPIPIVTDLKSSDSVNHAFEKIKDDFGSIDVLCSVAGIFLNETPISIQKDTEWNDVIETNLTGVMRCLRSSWPLFRRGASIVTVGSVLGNMSQPDVGAYLSVRGEVLDLLNMIQHSSKISYVFVSHDLEVIRNVSNNIVNKIIFIIK